MVTPSYDIVRTLSPTMANPLASTMSSFHDLTNTSTIAATPTSSNLLQFLQDSLLYLETNASIENKYQREVPNLDNGVNFESSTVVSTITTAPTSGSVVSIFVLVVLATITNGLLMTVLLTRRPLRAIPSNRYAALFLYLVTTIGLFFLFFFKICVDCCIILFHYLYLK